MAISSRETFFDYDLEEQVDDFTLAMTAVMKSAMGTNTNSNDNPILNNPSPTQTQTQTQIRDLARSIKAAKVIRDRILRYAKDLQGGEYLEHHLQNVEALSVELHFLDAHLRSQATHNPNYHGSGLSPSSRTSANAALNVALFTARLLRRTRKRTKEDREVIAKDLGHVWSEWRRRSKGSGER
ncbi:hypothetical protein SCHPADRAFT_738088 [Schizopora paradoxa]|uniref:Uncharacterized protein n=1 Tax=Schizopora paradoxa TaxID=27342 RepID=A0A0H2R6G0_9AGAM|nr:hypothetical protein SCHPADRAFT_738088 [Schizopora paradoxa]